jgi:hypothetical protein
MFPGKAKGVRAILEERGLWNHYSQKVRDDGQPALKLYCKECAKSNIQKDILQKSEHLIQQAEADGYFLSPSQSIQEVLSASQLPQDADIDQATRMNEANNLNENQKTCCWSKILLLQSDFLNEQPLLQTIIEDAGHVCLFLPNFHCELNPIELFWSYIKSKKLMSFNLNDFLKQLN